MNDATNIQKLNAATVTAREEWVNVYGHNVYVVQLASQGSACVCPSKIGDYNIVQYTDNLFISNEELNLLKTEKPGFNKTLSQTIWCYLNDE